MGKMGKDLEAEKDSRKDMGLLGVGEEWVNLPGLLIFT